MYNRVVPKNRFFFISESRYLTKVVVWYPQLRKKNKKKSKLTLQFTHETESLEEYFLNLIFLKITKLDFFL